MDRESTQEEKRGCKEDLGNKKKKAKEKGLN